MPLQLQVIPAEMLPHSDNRELGGGSARVEMGIEFDAIGRRRSYHFLRAHPGGSGVLGGLGDTVRVPAEEVLHLFRPTVAGQIRGVPHTLSAITKLAILDQYDDAQLERKRVAALFGGFVTRPAPLEDEEVLPLPGVLDRERAWRGSVTTARPSSTVAAPRSSERLRRWTGRSPPWRADGSFRSCHLSALVGRGAPKVETLVF